VAGIRSASLVLKRCCDSFIRGFVEEINTLPWDTYGDFLASLERPPSIGNGDKVFTGLSRVREIEMFFPSDVLDNGDLTSKDVFVLSLIHI